MSYALLPMLAVSNLLRRACYSLLCLHLSYSGAFADPEVSKVWGQQKVPTYKVDIFYDLSEAATVSLAVSADGGANWGIVRVDSCSLDIGTNVTAGTGKHILWDAGTDWPGQYSSAVRFKVTATACAPDPSIPVGMVLIRAGSFQMGDNLGDGWSAEVPVHTVYVSAFYMDRTEVTWGKWKEVRTWSATRGYDIGSVGSGKADNHPVQSVNWYDCIKWLNARSEMEGLTPCYRRGGVVYKAEQHDDIVCAWSANGYRLPTEAEWEKAARGGLSGRRFPWGDTIQHTRANYYSSAGYAYDTSATPGFHPSYATDFPPNFPLTNPVGAFAANGYGLHDMAGNLLEWCWDWFDDYPSGSVSNPHGPSSPSGSWGSNRVIRGGSWGADGARRCRVAFRDNYRPDYMHYIIGFRAVRPPGQQ
ncbi:MAG: SUMF1/EgtB/PvdO family nonheme iron enzyme [bacterium]